MHGGGLVQAHTTIEPGMGCLRISKGSETLQPTTAYWQEYLKRLDRETHLGKALLTPGNLALASVLVLGAPGLKLVGDGLLANLLCLLLVDGLHQHTLVLVDITLHLITTISQSHQNTLNNTIPICNLHLMSAPLRYHCRRNISELQ